MNFLQRHRKTRKPLFIVQIFLVAAALIGILQFDFIRAPLSRGTLFLATPLFRAGDYVAGKSSLWGGILLTKKSLMEENKSLKDQVLRMHVALLDRDLLAQENEELKTTFLRDTKYKKDILAVVLSKPNQSPYDTLVLDIGKNKGIATGDKVIAYGDAVIGTIERVYENNSLARLYSSAGEEIEVNMGKSNIFAVAHGIGGGNFEAKLPRGISVEEGDVITLPSLKTQIVGVVEKIELKPTDSLQTIRFKSPVNMNELKWVEIIPPTF